MASKLNNDDDSSNFKDSLLRSRNDKGGGRSYRVILIACPLRPFIPGRERRRFLVIDLIGDPLSLLSVARVSLPKTTTTTSQEYGGEKQSQQASSSSSSSSDGLQWAVALLLDSVTNHTSSSGHPSWTRWVSCFIIFLN